MARTFVRQDTQIRNSDAYTDNVAFGATMESAPTHIEDDFNNLRSQVHRILSDVGGNWYDDLPSFTNIDSESKRRAIDDLNTELDALEVKRILCRAQILTDVSVTAAQNWEILSVAGSETPTQVSAIGVGTDRGAVTALSGLASGAAFNAHELVEVAGANATQPKNLCIIRNATTGEVITSSDRNVYGLLQSESSAVSGTAFDDVSGGDRVKISFVRLNAGFDDLEACPVGDIAGLTINYSYVFRQRWEDFPEDCFLSDSFIDQAAAIDVTRQATYDNQGVTVVTTTVNHTLDLGTGTTWEIGDLASAPLFQVVEGSGGGTSQLNINAGVDEFDVDAVVNNFSAGVSTNSGGTRPIDVGVNDGVIESTAGDLRIASDPDGASELYFDDGNQPGSTWAQTDGIKLSENTQEWDDYETAFGGEVSLLRGIYLAQTTSARDKTCANVTSTTTADTDVGGTAGGTNLDAQIHDISMGDFLNDHDAYLNGQLLRGGADASANNDYYPGTSLALGQLRFEFVVKINDVLCVISYA